MAFPSEGVPWVVGRSYNPRQETSGSAHRDSDGYQGKNWFQISQPEIVLYEHVSDDLEDVLYLIYGADRFVEFARVDTGSGASTTTFKATNGAAGVFLFGAGATSEPDTYTLTDQGGVEWTFFGFDADASGAEGQFWKVEDNAGNVAFAGGSTTGSTAISSGYSSGKITTAYDSEDRRYTYTYTTLDGASRLTEVEAETKTGGTWASPTGLGTVGAVAYEYYSDEAHGDPGDLKLVEFTTPLSDTGVESTAKAYYRYWEGTYHSTTNPGYPHHLKYIVGPEGTRRHDWQDQTFDEDFISESEANLQPYAEAYFAYDASHRVDEAWFNGNCGCGGSNNGTHTFEYESITGFVASAGYTDLAYSRTIVGQPDGSFVTQNFDEVGQALTRIVTDDDPAAMSAPDQWVNHVDRDASGMLTTLYTPAAVTAYTHATGLVTTSSSTGLVTTLQRETTGATKHFLLSSKWQEGATGTAYFGDSKTYATGSITVGDDAVVRPVAASVTEYTEEITSGSSGANTTSMTTTFYSSSLAIEKVVSTLPAAATSKNGSGSTDTRSGYIDEEGRTVFTKNTEGIIGYREYTAGQVTKRIEDADTSKTGAGEDFNGVTIPSGFSSSGTPLHRVTTSSYDAQGRGDESIAVDGQTGKSYYTRLADERLVRLSYPDYEYGTGTYHGPASYAVGNLAGKNESTGVVAFTGNKTTTGQASHIDETESDPITAVDTGTLVRLSTGLFNESGYQLDESRAYFDIPSSGAGTDGANYDPTLYSYDTMGRQNRTLASHGTIARTVFDAIGRRESSRVGTNDFGETGGSVSGTNDMVQTAATVYDGGGDGGNGHVTQTTAYRDATTGDSTSYAYDVRGRLLLETRPTAPHSFHAYDNLGRRTATAQYSSTASVSTSADDPVNESTNRLALSRSYYDERGQMWKSTRHEIDLADGSDDDSLESLRWYDSEGRVLKVDGGQLTKTGYDRIGRSERSFVLARDNDSVYSDVDDLSGDIVLTERQSLYEDDELAMSVQIDRFHDDYGAGETVGALDTNADGDPDSLTAGDLEGRAQIRTSWYDRYGRQVDYASYGTNGGATFDRSSVSTAPASAENNPVRSTDFGNDGQVQESTDPLGRVERRDYDDLGRLVKVIKNYDATVNSGNPSGADDNQTVLYEYTDGLRIKITADVPSGGTDQETVYTYGTTKGAGAGDSKIATGHLLAEVEYPDSGGAADVVTYAYDAQGRRIYVKDQAGNIIDESYDDSGRLAARSVSTLAADFDGAVRRIATSYDDLGRRDTVTQYDAATSGSVVDQVAYSYDGWSNVLKFEQDRNSEVGASGSVDDYEVAYTYEKATGGRNTIRRTGITLPSGNAITYGYASGSGQFADDASRVSGVTDGGVLLVRYQYNGVEQVVSTIYPEAGLRYIQHGSTSGVYDRLDRFSRVTNVSWSNPNGASVYDVDLEWDRGGNILSIDDQIHDGFDVKVSIDDLNRVTRAHEGTLSGGSISSATRDQQWALDQLGNWDGNQVDLNGDADFVDPDELDEDRSHNAVNEITARDIDDDGTDDYTLAFDPVGQLTDDGEEYAYVWDAFGRLRRIEDRSTSKLVEEMTYNGLGYRSSEHYDTDDDGDVDSSDNVRWHTYDEHWRMVATYREDDSDPKEEWVNNQAGYGQGQGVGGLNGIVARYRDSNSGEEGASDGVLEERVYYCQGWKSDVVALVGSSGYQLESVRYSMTGDPFSLPGGDVDSDGRCDAADRSQVAVWISNSVYDTRGDLDLDGDVDAADQSALVAFYLGTVGGRGVLSGGGSNFGSRGRAHAIMNSRLCYESIGWTSTGLGVSLARVFRGGPPVFYVLDDRMWGADGYGRPGSEEGSEHAFASLGGGGGLKPGSTLGEWGGFPAFEIPPCPQVMPKKDKVGDGWCADKPRGHVGADTCFRSYGTFTVGGQQCCYAFGVLLVTGVGAGSIDKVGVAVSEHLGWLWGFGKKGTCAVNLALVLGHYALDVRPWQADPEKYDAAQQEMRDKGVPTGSSGSGEYSDGITDGELAEEWDEANDSL